jgi:ribosomal protein L11 methyltransferase
VGSFADLGCGSGVLAILARRLGWGPVSAIDVQAASVEAARQNAERNGVSIDARVIDLSTHPAPDVAGFAANVPPVIHLRIAAGWERSAPAIGMLSGFGPDQAQTVIDAYTACGLHEHRRYERFGWVVSEVRDA